MMLCLLHWRRTAASGLLAFLLAWSAALAAAEAEFLPPDQAFRFSHTTTASGERLLNWDIAPGYYLYQQRLKITVGGQPLAGVVWLSEPEEKDDPNFGRVNIFHQQLQLRIPAVAEETLLSYQGCAEGGLCYPPIKQRIPASAAASLPVATTATQDAEPAVQAAEIQIDTLDRDEDAGAIAAMLTQADGYWVVLTFLALGLGLAFTPCVLPMVPILAAIIAGQGAQITVRRGLGLSLAYVLGMSVTYTLAGVLVGYFGARMNLQAALQSPLALSLFAALFVVLALAMFGFYELQLPAFLRDRLDRLGRNSKGGKYAGVALMGLVSALVVSPCVSAPLAGALVYISTTGDALLGGASLFALSLGMGVPLILVGAGGGRWLPRAGGWMLEVKAFFGVLLLGIAISLLSRILPGTISILLWAVLTIVYAVHLGNWGQSQERSSWSKTRLGLSLVLAAYGLTLLLGGLAGQQDLRFPLRFAASPVVGIGQTAVSPLFRRFDTVAALNAALQQAQADGRPVVLDLYADWCTSCKVMEHEVFARPEVQALAEQVTFLQLDITANRSEHSDFLQRYGLFGPPALLFIQPDGQELASARVQGELNARQFVAQVNKLL